MKKTYMTPVTEMIDVEVKEQLLTVSGGDTGIGYGGVDESGTLDPANRDADTDWTNPLFPLQAVKGPTFAYGKPGIPSKGTPGLP